MTAKYADLHLHTTASDGTQDIPTLISRARARGLSTIAVTDHDTISDELKERVTEISGMEVITGVELKVDYDGAAGELLGYFIDPLSEPMRRLFEFMRDARRVRMEEMVRRCRERAGIDVSIDEVRDLAAGSIGRPHLAKILVDKGAVRDMREAFDRLIGGGGECYVKLRRPGFREAVRAAAGPDAVFGSDVFAPSIALLGGQDYPRWERNVDFLTGGSSYGGVVGWATGVIDLAGTWTPALCDAVAGLEEGEALDLIFRLFGMDDLDLPRRLDELRTGSVPLEELFDREVQRLVAGTRGLVPLYPPVSAQGNPDVVSQLCRSVSEAGCDGAMLGLDPDRKDSLAEVARYLGR
jgi:predicted metal-dependent phosphoesterase TrpH